MLLPLSGCAIENTTPPADLSLPDHWRHTLHEETGEVATPPLQTNTWWRRFDDEELNRLIARVTDENLQLHEMAARVSAASALAPTAASSFRPSVRFTTAPAETPDSRGAYLQAGIESSWPLGLFGRAVATRAAARVDTELTRTDAALLESTIVADAVRAYVEWRSALAGDANLDAQISAQRERVALMRARVRLRLSGPQDLMTEQLRADELQSARLTAAREMTVAAERLGLLTATAEPYVPGSVAFSSPTLVLPSLQSLPADLLRSRADVRHAEQAALKAAAELNIAKADLYPQLTLVGSLSASFPIAGSVNGTARGLAALAPVIDIPLFDWGRRRAVVTAQEKTLEAALLAYRESILNGVHEVESALGALDFLEQEAQVRREALIRAEGVEAGTHASVRLGRASRLDELASTLARLEALASVESTEHARAMAYIELCQALGGTGEAM